jgi:hypothetical protein
MRLLDGFNLFFNPAFAIEKLFTLWGGGGGKGGDDAEYIPIRPANVTTGFGTGLADPERGKYNYTLDPRLAAMRDIFYGAAPQFMPTAQEQQFARDVSQQGMGIFGQGQEFLNQALGMNTGDVAQRYYSDVQNLMAGDRAEEEARLANTLFKTGRTGAAVGVQGGYVNPEQFALLRARELANQQLGIQAEELGRSRREADVGFGTRLMGTGLGTIGSGQQVAASPYQTMASIFGLGTGIEQLGMQNTLGTAMAALPIHAQIQAGRQAVENANAAASGKGGGLLGSVANAGLNYALSGGNPLAAAGSALGSIWSGSSPSSGLASVFGSTGGWGGNLGVWNPISTNIGMGGVQAPVNFGGGTLGPRF